VIGASGAVALEQCAGFLQPPQSIAAKTACRAIGASVVGPLAPSASSQEIAHHVRADIAFYRDPGTSLCSPSF
jgi:hypothetical protein